MAAHPPDLSVGRAGCLQTAAAAAAVAAVCGGGWQQMRSAVSAAVEGRIWR